MEHTMRGSAPVTDAYVGMRDAEVECLRREVQRLRRERAALVRQVRDLERGPHCMKCDDHHAAGRCPVYAEFAEYDDAC